MRVLVAMTGVLGALVLAGCGSGQDAATARTRPSIPGVDANAGDIQVRNAVVEFSPAGYAPGEDAFATLSIANAGQEPFTLTQVTSEGAGAVTVHSATHVGAASPSPGVGGTPQVPVSPGQLVAVRLRLTSLRQALNGTAAIPVTLTFDGGVDVPLAVPMDTPMEAQPREAPAVEPPEH
jgi:copper(I)-binding protein